MNPEIKDMLDTFRKKAVQIGKVVKEDALIGAQMGKHKVKELDLERKRLLKFVEIGKKAFALHKKGKLIQKDLAASCEQIDSLEKDISKQKSAFSQQKKKLKKIPLK